MFGRMPCMPRLALAAALAAASVPALAGPPAPRARLSAPNLPLTFEKNTGRYPKEVQFVARGGGGALFLTRREAVLSLRKGEKAAALRLKLQGSNPKAVASGLDKQPGVVSYFIGNDPKQWRTNVPTYSRVKLAGVYPGVDLVYYGAGKSRTLEYDFVVKPGADASRIRMAVSGAKSLRTVGGRLVASTACGDVTLNRPYAYQAIDGKRTQVACSFTVDRNTVAFQVAKYDTSRPLVVDPTLEYSTYLGSSGEDRAYGVALDASGAAIVCGRTRGTGFPTTAGAVQRVSGGASGNDAFVTKLAADGKTLIYSTFLGGRSDDKAIAVAVAADGAAFVGGDTFSRDFPTTAGAFATVRDGITSGIVTKLAADGASLVYSTYLGGDGEETVRGIALDGAGAGAAFVCGSTTSTDFPTTAGAYCTTYAWRSDAFVTKLSANGSSLLYSTYLGGVESDAAYAIAVDGTGAATVCGQTESSEYPTTPGAYQRVVGYSDAFVTKLSANGAALIYSTLLGGDDYDIAFGIALDAAGAAVICGGARSTGFPTTAGAFCRTLNGPSDGFVAKFAVNGTSLAYSTLLGGADWDQAQGIALTGDGSAVVCGRAASTDYPTTADAFAGAAGGGGDAFVTVLDPTASALVYSTYLGGGSWDAALGVAVGSGLTVVCGETDSAAFPTVSGSFSTTSSGSTDGFVIKMLDTVPTTLTMDGATATAGSRTTLRARLTNPAGAGVSGRRVEFQIGAGPWVPAEILTSAIGYATLTITAPPTGGYNVGVRFQAVAPYLASDATSSLTTTDLAATTTTVSRAEASVGDGVRLVAYLRAPAGSTTVGGGIAGKGVEFRLDRGPWTAASGLTDATGKAELALTALEGGTHDIEARFTGDATYAASNGSSTLTVAAKRNVYVYTINRSVKAGTAGTLIAYFYWYQKNGTLTPISGKSLRFQCAGVSLDSTATTDASGKATVSVTPASAGSYPFTVGFTADAEYNAGTGAGTLTIAP